MSKEDKQKAIILVYRTNPVTPEVLKEAEKLGMIPKSELENGAVYKGSCRNAWIAEWHEHKNCFVYLRTKFGSVFAEEINHPEDDKGFDVFIPVEKIERDY